MCHRSALDQVFSCGFWPSTRQTLSVSLRADSGRLLAGGTLVTCHGDIFWFLVKYKYCDNYNKLIFIKYCNIFKTIIVTVQATPVKQCSFSQKGEFRVMHMYKWQSNLIKVIQTYNIISAMTLKKCYSLLFLLSLSDWFYQNSNFLTRFFKASQHFGNCFYWCKFHT